MNEQSVMNKASVLAKRSHNFEIIGLNENNKANMFQMIKAIKESIKPVRDRTKYCKDRQNAIKAENYTHTYNLEETG